ncbi:unnamed protein product [Rotaria sp. Silwood2]|nr:unnamed protein product [Rotaria sp. Silwood2]CAF2824078.1 unnamed protein product [Rotaria sp. Silwood2]CAF3100667.1 unnamed protein product [Rotaria sp. Silwood2]CAF3308195.1 unnamed protein product [Rotaria sp. Silwood2]CAF4031505.1 unnamed protein product [Rotaria sp. Silwood2]
MNAFDKFSYGQQLLKLQSKKKKIKQWQPKLTSEEKILFNEEKLLSTYQHIIANTYGQHRRRQQVYKIKI